MGMTERPIVLQGTGVRKYFPVHTGFGKPKKYVKAVDGVDITIHEGEIYGLVGETGCGKSTLGRTLIRLTDPTDGNISVLGKDITKLNDKQMTDMRQKIQMVFQDPYTSLDPKQKVGDILMETLEIHGISTGEPENITIIMSGTTSKSSSISLSCAYRSFIFGRSCPSRS